MDIPEPSGSHPIIERIIKNRLDWESMHSDSESETPVKTLTIPSDKDRLYEVQGFVEDCLAGCGASDKTLMQLELVVEEIFINISSYAYRPPGSGDVDISCSVEEDVMKVTITFTDEGPEFDPLEREDPDTTQSLDKRQVGGLGIFLVKRNVDGISYRRDGGRNILTIEKRLP